MCPVVIVDCSASGLGLAADQPEPTGAILALEWPGSAAPLHTPRIVHAEVVRCAPDLPGGWRLGVRIASSPPHEAVPVLPDPTAPTSPVAMLADPPAIEPDAEGNNHVRRKTRRGRRWIALLLLILLAGLPLVLAPATVRDGISRQAAHAWGADGAEGTTAAAGPRRVLPAEHFPLEGIPAEALVLRLRTEEAPAPQVDPVADTLTAARLALARGDLAVADAAFAAVLADPAATDAQRRRARSGLGFGAPGDDRGAVPQARMATSPVPVVVAGQPAQRSADARQSSRAAARETLPSHWGIEDRPAPPPDAPVFIEVDRARFEMTVYAFGQPTARYPVGLGAGGSTPVGDFVIANRLRNPTWHDRGRAVPPDDPEYPLGGYWMGLATADGRIPYGFHGTNEPESIGRAAGRGCIRLGPPDVAALFQCVTVGTPVRIF